MGGTPGLSSEAGAAGVVGDASVDGEGQGKGGAAGDGSDAGVRVARPNGFKEGFDFELEWLAGGDVELPEGEAGGWVGGVGGWLGVGAGLEMREAFG